MRRYSKNLICNCCGQYAKGRQWWNRDTGYGLCVSCGEEALKRGKSIEEVEFENGKRGIHWDIDYTPKLERSA